MFECISVRARPQIFGLAWSEQCPRAMKALKGFLTVLNGKMAVCVNPADQPYQ